MVLFRLSLAVLAVVLMSACNGGSSSRDAGSGAEARPTLSADDLVEAEGDVTRELPVVLRLSAAAAGEVVVRVRSEDGSALAGEDYTAVDRDV
ncbi:Calx-beta domain-containing protein, partial [Amnimonas aquatica]